MYVIENISLEYAGTLYLTLKDNNKKIEFSFIFCGWRIKNNLGKIITAIFNDPNINDKEFSDIINEEITDIKYDNYDCRITTKSGFIIETFALHNDIENKGFYIEETTT